MAGRIQRLLEHGYLGVSDDFLLAELYFGKTFVTIPHLGGRGINGDLTPKRWMEPRFEFFSSWELQALKRAATGAGFCRSQSYDPHTVLFVASARRKGPAEISTGPFVPTLRM